MAALRLLGFDGLIPRLSPTLLAAEFAQIATNVKLYSKELRYWRGPLMVYAPPVGDYQTLYRLFDDTGATAFLLWETEVDVAVSPVADQAGESRIYYTGDGYPKKTNWAMATGGAAPFPSAFMPMGVPAPIGKPTTVLTVAGTGTMETRSYVYTNVSTFGLVKSESAPSPPSDLLNVPPVGSTVTVSGFSAVPANPADSSYNITHRRIYRTVAGATTDSFQFVAEIPVGAASYADSKTVAELGEVIPTSGWDMPLNELKGLVALPSGALAAFVGNEVFFSVPYYPHAWPAAYSIALPVREIIGLGVVGSSLAVMTTTNPYFIHGGVPGEMYVEKIPLQEPCVAKTTIATDENGVVYASPNGLVVLSTSMRALSTSSLFTTDEWKPLSPQTMKAATLQGRYFGVFPDTVPPKAIVLAKDDPPALSYMQLPAQALHVDAVNGFLFYVHSTDSKVYQLDADEGVPLTYQWKSKRFFQDVAQTYSLLRLDADYSQIIDLRAYEAEVARVTAWNAANYAQDLMGAINAIPINAFDAVSAAGRPGVEINGSILLNMPRIISSRSVQIILYGDGGRQRAVLNPFSLDPIRVPPFKSREFEVEIVGNISVRSLHLATTMEELKAT